MDRSREADIEQLKARLFDMSAPYFMRCVMGRSLLKVQREMKDRCITNMRQQLIRATVSNDENMVEQISYRIKQYQRG